MALWTTILKLKVDNSDNELFYSRYQTARMKVTDYPDFSAYMAGLKISWNLIKLGSKELKISGTEVFFQITNATPTEAD